MGRHVDIGTLDANLKFALISGNILVTIFAACGNVVAVVVAFKSRWTSSPTKLCLISLSISDLLLTATSTPVDLDQLMDTLHAWHLGTFLCKFLPFAQFLCLLVNSVSLLAMIIQRYWSTSIFLASRIYNRAENSSKIITAIVFSFIWLIPFGFSIPYLGAYSLKYFNCTTNTTTSDPTEAISSGTIELIRANGSIKTEYQATSKETYYCFRVGKSPARQSSIETTTEFSNADDWNTVENTMDNLTNLELSSRLISICQQTREAHVALYHMATGVIYLFVIVAYFMGFSYFRRMREVQGSFEKSLVPTSLPIATLATTPSYSITTESTRNVSDTQVRNAQLLSEIRKMLLRQRKGIRLIQQLIFVYVVCRMPIWIYTIINENQVYRRSRSMLGIYFTLHLLANVKGAVTPFLYCHTSQSMRSTDSKFARGHGDNYYSNNYGRGDSNRSSGSDVSHSTSTATTISADNVNQVIIDRCIVGNNQHLHSAMKMTQPIKFLNYFRCGCLARRKNSSSYILQDMQ